MTDHAFTPVHPAEPLVLSSAGASIHGDEVIFGDSRALRWNPRHTALSL